MISGQELLVAIRAFKLLRACKDSIRSAYGAVAVEIGFMAILFRFHFHFFISDKLCYNTESVAYPAIMLAGIRGTDSDV